MLCGMHIKFYFQSKGHPTNSKTSNFPLKINLFVASSWLLNTKFATQKTKIEFLNFIYASFMYIFVRTLDKPCFSKHVPLHLQRTFGPSLFLRDKLWAVKWLTLVEQNSSERNFRGICDLYLLYWFYNTEKCIIYWARLSLLLRLFVVSLATSGWQLFLGRFPWQLR